MQTKDYRSAETFSFYSETSESAFRKVIPYNGSLKRLYSIVNVYVIKGIKWRTIEPPINGVSFAHAAGIRIFLKNNNNGSRKFSSNLL